MLAGQAQKEFTVNEALARLDLLVNPAVASERNDPPPAPVAGQCYLVGSDPTAEWTGHADAIAGWDGTQWTFVDPLAGLTVRDLSSGVLRIYSGGWKTFAAPTMPTGGTTIDTAAREAITQLIAQLKSFGIFS